MAIKRAPGIGENGIFGGACPAIPSYDEVLREQISDENRETEALLHRALRAEGEVQRLEAELARLQGNPLADEDGEFMVGHI